MLETLLARYLGKFLKAGRSLVCFATHSVWCPYLHWLLVMITSTNSPSKMLLPKVSKVWNTKLERMGWRENQQRNFHKFGSKSRFSMIFPTKPNWKFRHLPHQCDARSRTCLALLKARKTRVGAVIHLQRKRRYTQPFQEEITRYPWKIARNTSAVAVWSTGMLKATIANDGCAIYFRYPTGFSAAQNLTGMVCGLGFTKCLHDSSMNHESPNSQMNPSHFRWITELTELENPKNGLPQFQKPLFNPIDIICICPGLYSGAHLGAFVERIGEAQGAHPWGNSWETHGIFVAQKWRFRGKSSMDFPAIFEYRTMGL